MSVHRFLTLMACRWLAVMYSSAAWRHWFMRLWSRAFSSSHRQSGLSAFSASFACVSGSSLNSASASSWPRVSWLKSLALPRVVCGMPAILMRRRTKLALRPVLSASSSIDAPRSRSPWYPSASSMGVRSARCVFSMSMISRSSLSVRSRMVQGIMLRPALMQAW